MKVIGICFTIVALFTPLCIASEQAHILEHQYYTATLDQAMEAVQFVLNDIGIGVLGIDQNTSVVVSRTRELTESDSDLYKRFDQDNLFFAILVVSVANNEPGTVEVDISTLIHAKGAKRGILREHGWVGGNSLTQRVYDGLERYLGKGLLRPLGE